MQLRIRKPFDTMEYYETSLTCSTFNFTKRENIGYNRGAKDPVHSGLAAFWRSLLML